jgi:hypothetical protein
MGTRRSPWTTRSPGLSHYYAAGGHADVVDVSVVLCVRQRNLDVIASDPEDLRAVDKGVVLHLRSPGFAGA